MVRLAHFSDIHVTSPVLDWTNRDWFSKRLTSWFNHRFARSVFFSEAEKIAATLMTDLASRRIDHAVFSGDATALGFESELKRAATALGLGAGMPTIPGLAVPGNHDYCTVHAAASGHFERHFAGWQNGLRIGEYPYPFAQKVGPVWLIGVNAATGNRWPWDAGGSVGPDQLARLRELLASLEEGIRVLVLHFPIQRSNGRREIWFHGLRDLDSLLDVANAGGVHLWLHGHRHSPYHFQTPAGARFPVICAGTATQRGLWSYGEYTIEGVQLTGLRRVYDPKLHRFKDADGFSLELTAVGNP